MKQVEILTSWRVAGLHLAAVASATMLVGLLLDHVFATMIVVLAGYLTWHSWNLLNLDNWLRRRRFTEPPEGRGVWASIYDALYRRQREERKRRRRLATIIREFRDATVALPDAIVVLDQSDQIQWSNPGAHTLLGLHKGQDLGRPITNLLRDPQVRLWLERQRNDPNGLITRSPVDATLSLRLRVFDYGRDGQHILMARDITEMQRLDAMRKDFVADVSHELRTPLTVISGYLETMAQAADPEWKPVVDKIELQSTRMKAIVEDLLTLSRLDAADELENEGPIVIEELISAVIAEGEALSHGKHRFIASVQAGVDLRGSVDEMRSALTNLIANAVRYSPDGSDITLGWRILDNRAELSVGDNGPGIAAQHLPRLTERFYRVSGDRSRASGGTGLGLAIVKHILMLHDGQLRISSEPGVGSEFICQFPNARMVNRVSPAK